MLQRFLILLVLSLAVHFCDAQAKSLTALKATQAPRLDGDLGDEVWATAPEAINFIQNAPAYGRPATQKAVVKILYDDEAVYIGAHLFDDPKLVRTQFTSRDGEQRQDVDYFAVFFDTYRDQQNGFEFLVTSANVQSDARLGGIAVPDYGEYGDKTWDAVWQSRTAITTDGWTAEIRIPYLSLRFSKKDLQSWGLQFLRFTRRNNELDFWNAVDPNLAGFANQFGIYADLKNIKPPLRLSFSPYVSGGIRQTPKQTGNATKYETEWLRNGGMDVKYGINESFTLDATLVPDFGQVVSDNVVNNLTPYEIRFTENRPFFTEGTELFNKAGLFYSRRIGAAPADYNRVNRLLANDTLYGLRKNPGVTQLYNAIKFSGRTKNKLGIGLFNALAAPQQAQLYGFGTHSDTLIRTEQLTNYNILVLDQAFNGRSYVTFTNTNVTRSGITRDANVAALNFAAYDKASTYSVTCGLRYSKIFGYTPTNMIATPYRYISDITDTVIGGRSYINPYDGYRTSLSAGKVSGKIQYTAAVNIQSDAYDPNDLGYIEAPNKVTYTGSFSYNQYTPTKKFINYFYNFKIVNTRLYKPYSNASTELNASATWIFKNFWDVTFLAGTKPFWQNDYFELQTRNKYVKLPPYWYAFISGSTDSRKRLFVSYNVGWADAGVYADNSYLETSGGIRYRFSDKFSLSLNLERRHDNLQIGYAFLNTPAGAPVLGFRDYKDVTAVLSGSYNFTARMNITFRSRHYWNAVQYKRFFTVKDDGFYTPLAFIDEQDQNFNIFNLDAFYTWDFKPGSRVIAGYKNSLGSDYFFDLAGKPYERYARNLTNSFSLPHGNEFTVRFIYFLDYNQLRRHHYSRS